MTPKSVAEYYEVDVKTINKIVNRKKEVFKRNGSRYMTYDEYRGKVSSYGKFPRTGTWVHPDKSILLFSFLLKKSEVAHSIRKKFIKLNSGIDISDINILLDNEIIFMNNLEKILYEIDLVLERQKKIKTSNNVYYVDGYISTLNLAIEYDEYHHSLILEKDISREKEITKEIGCSFVRVKDGEDMFTNIGIVVKKILEIKIYNKHL